VHPSHKFQSGCRTNRKECIAMEPTLEKYLALVKRMEKNSRASPSSTLIERRTLKLMNSRRQQPAITLYQPMYSCRP
jgi:hypothetical protein